MASETLFPFQTEQWGAFQRWSCHREHKARRLRWDRSPSVLLSEGASPLAQHSAFHPPGSAAHGMVPTLLVRRVLPCRRSSVRFGAFE